MNQLSPKSMVLTRSAHKKMIEATTEVKAEEVPRTTAVETNDDSGNLRKHSPGTNGHSSAHTVKSKGNKSVRSTSSSIAARRKKLQLEAAEAKARIQLELIDLKLAANLKELDEVENCSLLSEGAIEHEPEQCIVENWLADNAQNQNMQTDLQPNRAMGPQASAAPHGPIATQDGMDGTVHALASALKDLAAATSAASTGGVNNRMLNRICTAKELPLFTGDPLDWLHFKKAFDESSRICNFSEDENLWRLRKSLHGAAKDAVTALLISATSVETIMSTLELQFGNPDVIINRILQDIYKLRPISQEYQKDIIPFSIKVRNYVAAVTTIGCEDYLNGMNILSLILAKLPIVLISKWTDYSYPLFNRMIKPKLVILSEFLTEEAEKITKTAVNLSSLVFGENLRHRGQAVLLNSRHIQEDGRIMCRYCHMSKHLLTDCKKFKKSLCKDRWAYVKRHGICFKCLISKHKQTDCSEPVCGVEDCGRSHHRLLHYAQNKNYLQQNRINITDVTEGETQTGIIAHVTSNDNKVLLKTVSVYIHGPNGIERTRALLDDGSTVTLISNNLATKLGLRGHKQSMRVCGAWNNGEVTCESEIINFNISNETGTMFNIHAYSVKDLNLPTQDYSALKLNSCGIMSPDMNNILMDKDCKPEILLGQDNYNLLMPLEIIKCKPSEPYLTRTLLGWCIHGCTRMPFKKGKSVLQSALVLSEKSYSSSDESNRILREMQEEMRHSFAIDSLGISSKPRQNREERQAIDHLDSTAKLIDGRWFIGLPWKNTNIKMPDSYENALMRLRGIEKNMKDNEGFATRYKERVDHLLQNDYASELDTILNPKHIWYLPHFGVDNPNKQNLRLVFDAAAKCKGISLNDFLLQGPDLLISLYGIMLRFRERKIAVTGDIKDMFLRVKIHKEDRDAFRFLWKESADKPIKVFTMSSLIFGANCSPFIAQFVKNKNATRFTSTFPDAVNAIWKQHYMDDYIDSFDNEVIATKLIKDVTYVHQQGGFEIRNFTSNCKSVLCHLPDESLKPTAVTFKNGQQFCTGERTLGLIWFPSEDTLGFDISFKKIPAPLIAGEKKPTKREMLRVIMSIFDIYGFLSPITIKGKIMLQDTWRSGITWDIEVTDDIYTRWKEWLDLLKKVSTLRVPRYYALATKDSKHTESVIKNKSVQSEYTDKCSYRNLQLHVFCDASMKAMCAAAYWRWYNSNNQVQVSLISSKSRVAPVKYVSMPRLELQAALLASRLANNIINEHRMIPTNTYFWCDSVTVLHWIRNDIRNYKAYVAHRLGEIDELTKINDWRYIPTKLNVADIATRELCDMKMLQNEWLYGPSFLYQEEVSWPVDCIMQQSLTSDILECINTCTVAPECLPAVPEPERFSSWLRLVRTTCIMLTFIAKCRKIPCNLAGERMEQAEILLIKYSQLKHFPDDLSNLKREKLLSRKSKLFTLTPILDTHGVLRVGGRINAASDVHIDVKQPVVLDGRCHIAHLIVQYYHVKACHGNQEMVVNEIKQRYWILRLRPTVKSVSTKCLFCRIRKAQPQPPRMGDLPKARIAHHHRPFTYTGIDLFGPLDVTVGRRHEKRYGVIFTCLTVRAIHIEIVNNLTTDALIMAVRRMAARRGWPRYLYSDNGTNLKGADTELRRCIMELDIDKLKNDIINYSMATSWTFIPPASPHWGGAWERLIRTIKSALYVILREQAPKDETLHTLMTEVEQMINSRPLTHVTVEPNCEETLTPNHFILGSSSNMPTLGVFDNSDSYLRKQWRISQRLADMFWRRWLREVLPEMRARTKWHEEQRPLEVGDFVLIIDPSSPRNVWPKGLVVAALPGKDGRIRVVDVKTQNGIFRRSATRVARIDLRNGTTFWVLICGAAALLLAILAVLACWIARRRNSLAHKLGGKRGPDKALVFQPPRRATAVRSPGSATHYLRKSPSPTAPAPPAANSPPQPQPPPQNPQQSSNNNSPNTPTAPTEPTPLSKELADANATEKIKTLEPETNDGKLGDLHFKLRYENEKNALVVSVVSCQNLPGREPAGPDPYVKLQLLPDKQHKVKTRVVRKTRCPVYDEDFTFYGIAPHQLAAITLHFVVLSFDRYSRDEIIGEVVSPLTNLQLQSGEAMALCREIQPRSLKMRSVGRGEVLVSLCWQPAAARLTVVLLKARNLPKMDVTGLADPYVKMYLLYNGQRIAKKKTHVKKRTLNPVFNESFVFEVPAAPNAALDHVSLELLVLDWDRVTKNEVIGRLELGANGAGSARHHWREVQAAPRRQIADWHKLKE